MQINYFLQDRYVCTCVRQGEPNEAVKVSSDQCEDNQCISQRTKKCGSDHHIAVWKIPKITASKLNIFLLCI